MEKIIWKDSMKNGEVWHRVKEEMYILPTVNVRKANWIRHIWRRNHRLKHIVEAKIGEGIEVTGRRRGRHKKLVDNLKEKRGYW
jgi:hypothetical protein